MTSRKIPRTKTVGGKSSKKSTTTRKNVSARSGTGGSSASSSRRTRGGGVARKKVGVTRGGKTSITRTRKKKPTRKKRITEKRFDKHTFSNPFSQKRNRYKTTFGQFYESGEIPCRISHGGSMTSITLKWDKDISSIPYNPYLVYFADGLRETEHPYVQLASVGFIELLKAEGAREKVIPIMDKIVPLIRKAFQAGGSNGFGRALDSVSALSDCVGEALTDHLNSLLIQINKKSFDRKFSMKIMNVLNTIEENSGKTVTKLIKTKVPTYSSIFM